MGNPAALAVRPDARASTSRHGVDQILGREGRSNNREWGRVGMMPENTHKALLW